MKSVCVILAAFALLCVCCVAQAVVNIETVRVGDAGNAADTRYFNPGYGSVNYVYRIGKYEVTTAQYAEFLNAVAKTDTNGLYVNYIPNNMNIQRTGSSGSYVYTVASDWANRPVTCVSYWDSLRFINWLNNGQLTGTQNASTTEEGAYTLNGYHGMDGRNITRNAGARWVLPSEDEWYKAAYYKGGGTNAGYWDYATQSNTAPGNQIASDQGNSANYNMWDGTNHYSIGSPYYRTEVGAFSNSASAYGTFDQAGNVLEWDEHTFGFQWNASNRGVRGGSYDDSSLLLRANREDGHFPDMEMNYVGFRVAFIEPVPEPSSLAAISAGGLCLLTGLRRRRN